MEIILTVYRLAGARLRILLLPLSSAGDTCGWGRAGTEVDAAFVG